LNRGVGLGHPIFDTCGFVQCFQGFRRGSDSLAQFQTMKFHRPSMKSRNRIIYLKPPLSQQSFRGPSLRNCDNSKRPICLLSGLQSVDILAAPVPVATRIWCNRFSQ
jgi:hypothetical protein